MMDSSQYLVKEDEFAEMLFFVLTEILRDVSECHSYTQIRISYFMIARWHCQLSEWHYIDGPAEGPDSHM